jgi:serine/threonine-protein kinase
VRPRRTSATTGLRLGKVTWPLLALVVLLLALLGAAFATRLTRADGSAGVPPAAMTLATDSDFSPSFAPDSPGSDPGNAMITTGVSAELSVSTLTTTAKDS